MKKMMDVRLDNLLPSKAKLAIREYVSDRIVERGNPNQLQCYKLVEINIEVIYPDFRNCSAQVKSWAWEIISEETKRYFDKQNTID
jgi:hypothetical protein